MNRAGLRLAVIGCGGWGINHVRAWHRLGVLTVVCDPDAARRAAAVAEAPGIEPYADVDAVLSRDDVDAVVLATPAVTHASLAIAAVQAGKHVLVEKPLAVTLAEAQAVVEAAERSGRVLMVGHVLEYHPAVLRLRQLVEEGVLGRLRYVYSNRLNFGKVRIEENSLWSFAPHDLALFNRIVGTMPDTVSCQGGSYLSPGVADVTLMSLSFPGGVQGHVFVSWLHPFKEQRFVVVGEKQMAVFDDTAPWPEKLVLYGHQVSWRGGRVPEARRAEGVAVELEPAEPLLEECKAFIHAATEGERVLTDGASALSVLRMLDAGERSMATGGHPQRLSQAALDDVSVHPTAIVEEGASLGAGTRVWHHAHVMAGARVGKRCSLGKNVFLGRGARIGDGVKIQNNVSVYEGVELEDGVFCGPSMVFTNVINPRAEVERKDEYRPTLVRHGASLGANCTIVCGVTIGRYALVGAGAVVTRDVPDFAIVTGVPARRTGWVCMCGVRLPDPDGASEGVVCAECGSRYIEEVSGCLVPRPGYDR
jgi:UDP-2-acetamido-3-amino-2,3-dideoxy-glucuronate N-acetyltransferase